MSDDSGLIPIVAILCVFGLPVFGWIVTRVLAHRERMEMMRRGIIPPPGGLPGAKDWGNRAGASAGIGMHPQPAPVPFDPRGPQAALHKGIRLTCIGLAVTTGLSFIGYDHGEISPGPWLLGGLIPTFIGVAQILSAVLAGATIRAPQAFGQPPPLYTVPPSEPPPAAPGPSPTYEGSYTYRPGSTQEVRPPPPPLDRR
jgi:hypothetical protein